MSINRNNYETYFLLYTDDELSAAEKLAVEEFVAQNPDLRQELRMLQECTLLPDDISLDNKGCLFRSGHAEDGMQEMLLLLLDGDLDAGSASAIEKVIEKDPALAREWQLLKQTRLAANDKIVFTYKASLYKGKQGRVVPLVWKIAAAAMLIGFGLWGTVAYVNNAAGVSENGSVAIDNPVLPGIEKKEGNIQSFSSIEDSIATAAVAKTKMPTATTNVDKTPMNQVSEKLTEAVAPLKSATAEAVAEKDFVQKGNHLPTPVLENINKSERNNNEVATVPSEIKSTEDINRLAADEAPQSYALHTAFNDNEKVSYGFDEEDQPKKNKVAGLLKKLNRVLQRKANIKSSNDGTFKVANLSFAVQ